MFEKSCGLNINHPLPLFFLRCWKLKKHCLIKNALSVNNSNWSFMDKSEEQACSFPSSMRRVRCLGRRTLVSQRWGGRERKGGERCRQSNREWGRRARATPQSGIKERCRVQNGAAPLKMVPYSAEPFPPSEANSCSYEVNATPFFF